MAQVSDTVIKVDDKQMEEIHKKIDRLETSAKIQHAQHHELCKLLCNWLESGDRGLDNRINVTQGFLIINFIVSFVAIALALVAFKQ